MFKIKIYILLIFSAFITISSAQNKSQYIIEGDEVVFNFDARNYKRFNKNGSIFSSKLNEIDIKEVTVAGSFNNWSTNQWRMKRTGEFTFELHKKLKDFDDEFSWEFKFVINNQYWAEPDKEFNNISESSQRSFWFSKIYNHKMYTAKPDTNGNAHFYLKGYENANRVILSGTFNRWNEEDFKMKKIKGGWKISLKLKPDTYEYKFIVDGNWMEDPDNPNKVYNEHLTFNSILNLKKQTTFELKGYQNARKIILAGSFNSWNKKDFVMKKSNNTWYYSLKLDGGKHHYKFIVDGEWIIDPSNPVKEYDEYGNINSVKMVD